MKKYDDILLIPKLIKSFKGFTQEVQIKTRCLLLYKLLLPSVVTNKETRLLTDNVLGVL